MSDLIYFNGKFLCTGRTVLAVNHPGFAYGDGLFETLKSCKGKIAALDLHLDRFFSSLKQLKFNPDFSKDTLKEITETLLKKNKLLKCDAYIKIIAARHSYSEKFRFDFTGHPDLAVIARRLVPYPEKMYTEGVKIISSSIERPPAGNNIYRYKLLNYFENIYAKNEAYAAGAEEALFMTRDRLVLECATSNIFAVKNGAVYTIPLNLNILPGVTRQCVIDLCRKLNINIYNRKLHYYNLLESDEIFITNSIMEIMPVKALDSHDLNKERIPGKITEVLISEYKKQLYL
jgi:branched-subunit amino acid aminotransferase/4-amino-4-deoxychorismate lyase